MLLCLILSLNNSYSGPWEAIYAHLEIVRKLYYSQDANIIVPLQILKVPNVDP